MKQRGLSKGIKLKIKCIKTPTKRSEKIKVNRVKKRREDIWEKLKRI